MIDALVGHLTADYLLQNGWMALNKKQRSFPCVVHCAIWTACVCLFAGWSSPVVIAVLFVSHFIQDRTQIIAWYMDHVGQYSFRTGPCAPWSAIVVDNVWHILTIWLLWRFAV